jgi:hypothetical protein
VNMRGIVLIKVAFMGNQPGPELRARVEELKRRLAADGTIYHGVEPGVARVNVNTKHVAQTRDLAWTAINDLGLSSRTTVRVQVPEA